MTNPDYEYRGMMAELWDFFRGDTSTWEDRFFYLEAIKRFGQPALDVGCGTGRLLLDYMAQGIDIDGVDNSPEMLKLLDDKAAQTGLQPRTYLQTMETLDLPRRYRTILVPSSSFQLVLDPRDAARAMERFYASLMNDGALVMPFMDIWKEGQPLEEEWPVKEMQRPQDGAIVRRYSRSRYDPQAQLEHTEDRYEIMLDGRVIAEELHRRSPATRWYSRAQVEDLYRQAGFGRLEFYSGAGVDFQPVKPDDYYYYAIGVRS